MSASPTLVAFRPKRFHCRTTAKNLVYIKYAKNENHLGNVRNSKRTRKHQDVFILKIWSTTDLKRNKFMMKGVL